MPNYNHENNSTDNNNRNCHFDYDIDSHWPDHKTDISEIFIGLTKELQNFYPIKKGVLIINENKATRYLATTTWNDGKVRKNLAIRIPQKSSLLEKIAENGQLYAENFCELFSGNSFERNLLIDDEAQSFMIQPLTYDAEIVGFIGYNSDEPMAFTTLEDGLLNNIAAKFARRLNEQLLLAEQG